MNENENTYQVDIAFTVFLVRGIANDDDSWSIIQFKTYGAPDAGKKVLNSSLVCAF